MRKILHIGTHKTATTSLQTALYENRLDLAKQGVVYPDITSWNMRQRAGHHPMAKALAEDPANGLALTQKILKKVEDEHDASNAIIFSSEQYYRHVLATGKRQDLRIRRENFVRLMAQTFGPETEIVIVLRRPDSFCESRHQERVKKTSCTQKINEFATDPEEFIGFDYAFQIQLLQKYFLKVHVLVFEQLIADTEKGSPEESFMKAIGLDVTFERPPRYLNESLHPFLVDFKRLMNHFNQQKKSTIREFKVLLQLQQEGAFEWSGQKLTMWSEHDRFAFLESCRASLDWLSEACPHLLREDGNLFPPVAQLPAYVPEMSIDTYEDILRKFLNGRSRMQAKPAQSGSKRRSKQVA